MKKIILVVTLTFTGLTTTFVACKKNQEYETSKPYSTLTSSNIYSIYKEVGNLHNTDIYNLLLNDDLVNSDYTLDLVHNSASSRTYNFVIENTEKLDINSIDSFNNAQILSDVINNKLYDNPKDSWDEFLDDNIKNKITERELILINELKDVYNNSYKLASPNEQSEYLVSNISTLINKYDKTHWNENEGDLVGGMLYISFYSSNLWSPSNNDNNPSNIPPIESVPMIVQADCIGYLYGWGKSWLWDEEPDSKKRIKAGVGTALEFSLLKRLAKYL